MDRKWYLSVVLICISLITNDNDHLYIFSGEISVQVFIFAHILNELFVFLLLVEMYIFKIQVPYQI